MVCHSFNNLECFPFQLNRVPNNVTTCSNTEKSRPSRVNREKSFPFSITYMTLRFSCSVASHIVSDTTIDIHDVLEVIAIHSGEARLSLRGLYNGRDSSSCLVAPVSRALGSFLLHWRDGCPFLRKFWLLPWSFSVVMAVFTSSYVLIIVPWVSAFVLDAPLRRLRSW